MINISPEHIIALIEQVKLLQQNYETVCHDASCADIPIPYESFGDDEEDQVHLDFYADRYN